MKIVKHFSLNTILFLIGVLLLGTLVVLKFKEKHGIGLQKEKAIATLKTELVNNNYILGTWQKWDDEIRIELDTLISKTRSDQNFEGRLPTRILMNEERNISANQSILSFDESAWKALQNSEVVEHLDYEVLYKLERVYNSQRELIDVYAEVPKIEIASKNDRKYSDSDARFILGLRRSFSKLQLVEQKLSYHYDDIFKLEGFNTKEEE